MTGPAELPPQQRRAQGVRLLGGTVAWLAGSATATFGAIGYMFEHYDFAPTRRPNVSSWCRWSRRRALPWRSHLVRLAS